MEMGADGWQLMLDSVKHPGSSPLASQKSLTMRDK